MEVPEKLFSARMTGRDGQVITLLRVGRTPTPGVGYTQILGQITSKLEGCKVEVGT